MCHAVSVNASCCFCQCVILFQSVCQTVSVSVSNSFSQYVILFHSMCQAVSVNVSYCFSLCIILFQSVHHTVSTVALKRCILLATVESIAAYGLESVPMTPSLCRQIDESHRQMIRAALSITWPETMSTAELT